MPTISEFLGLAIRLYYNDHNPPHVHVYYGEFHAILLIETLQVHGVFPRRASLLLLEWGMQYRAELRENWQRASRHEPLTRIPPLE